MAGQQSSFATNAEGEMRPRWGMVVKFRGLRDGGRP